MRRSLLLALILFILLFAPAALAGAGLITRSGTGLSAIGNGLYLVAAAVTVALPLWRASRERRNRPLPAACTGQGLTVCLIGLSGLLLLGAFAPRFPDTARAPYLIGIAVIILFTLIPLGLLGYLRRRFPHGPGSA